MGTNRAWAFCGYVWTTGCRSQNEKSGNFLWKFLCDQWMHKVEFRLRNFSVKFFAKIFMRSINARGRVQTSKFFSELFCEKFYAFNQRERSSSDFEIFQWNFLVYSGTIKNVFNIYRYIFFTWYFQELFWTCIVLFT